MTCLQQWVVTITMTCNGCIPRLCQLQLRWSNLVKTIMVFCSGAHIITNIWEQCKPLNTGKNSQKLSYCKNTSWRMHCNSDTRINLWQSVYQVVEDLGYGTALGGRAIGKWSVTLTQSTSWSNEFARSLHVCIPGIANSALSQLGIHRVWE